MQEDSHLEYGKCFKIEPNSGTTKSLNSRKDDEAAPPLSLSLSSPSRQLPTKSQNFTDDKSGISGLYLKHIANISAAQSGSSVPISGYCPTRHSSTTTASDQTSPAKPSSPPLAISPDQTFLGSCKHVFPCLSHRLSQHLQPPCQPQISNLHMGVLQPVRYTPCHASYNVWEHFVGERHDLQ